MKPNSLNKSFVSLYTFILTFINYLFNVLKVYSLIPSCIYSCFSSFLPCCSVPMKYEENNIPEICLTPLLPPFLRDSLLTALYLCSVAYSEIHLPHLRYRKHRSQNLRQSPQVSDIVKKNRHNSCCPNINV